MRFLVREKHDGVLLRSYLKGTCGVSERLLTRLKQHPAGILVNGERVTVRRILKTGDVVEIAERDEVPQEAFRREDLPFGILYEDDALLVVDKPPRMPTHPSNGHDGDTLANALAWHFAQRGEPFVFRPVSRLDRNTSGILTLAKNQYAASLLCEAMKRRELRKTYLALVEGEPPAGSGRLCTGIRRVRPGIVLREVCPPDAPGAECALTDYRVLERYANCTLLELTPLTGRTHQLRVQLASVGCPIVGDGLYGRDEPLLDRHALHAFRLELAHPITGGKLVFESPFPEELKNYCKT